MKYSLNTIKIAIITLFITAYSIVFIVTTTDKSSRIDLLLNQEIANLDSHYKVITDKFFIISEIANYEIFNTPKILSLIYTAKHAKSEKERDTIREVLYQELKPHFEHLKDSGVNMMQIAFANDMSFLRMHKKELYGDDLSKARYSFRYVNETKKPINGFEKGKVSHAFRNVFPLFYSEEYIGSVDISFSSKNMQESMLKLHDIDTNFIVHSSILDSAKYEKTDYMQSIEHKDFFSIQKDIEKYKTRITGKLKEEIEKNIRHRNAFALYYHDVQSSYIISFFPIKDIEKESRAAYIVSYTNSRYLEGMLHEYVWINSMAFFGLLLLSIALYHNLKQRIGLEATVKSRTQELEEEKVKALNATESKSRFLANMSHEIRTPINGIIGITYLLLQTKLTKKQRMLLEKMSISAGSLLGIINNILDFSKIEAGKLSIEKAEFKIQETVDNVVSSLEVMAKEKGVDIRISYKEEPKGCFLGDCLRLSQILTNLLGNAIKFTNDGEINITVEKTAPTRYRFEVKDSGIGLTPHEQQKLFGIFTQTDESTTRKYGGTGLGLAISKELVELMNGKIWVESQKDIGSSFIFEIELEEIEAALEHKTKKKLYSPRKSLGMKRILVAEDNLTNQLVMQGLLEEHVKKIDIAGNGQEALDMFEPGKYDLIIMDIQMPVMDGYEAAAEIRKLDRDIPIIALSANALKEEIQKTKASGMNEHLVKPIDPEILYETLNRYINPNSK